MATWGKWCTQFISIPQEIFVLDESNYTAHVFAGLAALELGSHGEARQHYKTAIGAQPQEQLAWKVRRGGDSWLYFGLWLHLNGF